MTALREALRLAWRGDKKALKALDETPDAVRHEAFAFARDVIAQDPAQTGKVLEWLEALVARTDVRALAATKELSKGAVSASGKGAATAASKAGNTVVWFAPHMDVCANIVASFERVRERADVCVFTITNDLIANALIAAHKRGVKVRLVSDDMKAGDLGSDIDRIARSGVAVRIDRTEAHMHHKFAVFDQRWLINGSYNWTRSANAVNRENCVSSDDPALVAAFTAEFERCWQDSSRW